MLHFHLLSAYELWIFNKMQFQVYFTFICYQLILIIELVPKMKNFCFDLMFLKVAPEVEKTEVFRKGWNFENQTYFVSCIMRKHYFLSQTKEKVFFPYFFHILYSFELFDCAVNFKFYLNIFIFLNMNTNQTSKEQYLNYKVATYFEISCLKGFWK